MTNDARPRRMYFNAFAMNTASHIMHGLWTHPDSREADYNDLRTWVELAKLLERGRFDALFLADAIGVYDVHRGGRETALREGFQLPLGDPAMLIPAMAYATEHLGFAFTHSVLQEHPFTFARRASTLDHLTGGRVAWNIVTTCLASAARNLGYGELPTHAERYARAEEYAQVLYKLWEGSWEDGAVLADRERGVYADPAKVHDIDHEGAYYSVAGPHLCAPSPQRTPVLYQAGSSDDGREFASRNAEAVFMRVLDPVGAAAMVDDVRARAARNGRSADDLIFFQGLSFVVASTEEEARRKDAEYREYLSTEGLAAHLSGNLGVDLSVFDPDQPVDSVPVHASHGVQGIIRYLTEATPGRTWTFGELIRASVLRQRVVGTPEQIADALQPWRAAGVDGINVMYDITPGSFADFIDGAVPVLQSRGLMQRDYAPGTLREKMFPSGEAALPKTHPATGFRRQRA